MTPEQGKNKRGGLAQQIYMFENSPFLAPKFMRHFGTFAHVLELLQPKPRRNSPLGKIQSSTSLYHPSVGRTIVPWRGKARDFFLGGGEQMWDGKDFLGPTDGIIIMIKIYNT